jgi:hypothetical protein
LTLWWEHLPDIDALVHFSAMAYDNSSEPHRVTHLKGTVKGKSGHLAKRIEKAAKTSPRYSPSFINDIPHK